MERKQKLIIVGIFIVVLVVIGVIALMTQSRSVVVPDSYYVVEYADGTKVNTSEELRKTKQIDGLEISVLQFTQQEGMLTMLGTITNTSQETKGGYMVNIILKKSDGTQIETMQGYVNEIQPQATIQLNISKTSNAINAYKYEIEKAD